MDFFIPILNTLAIAVVLVLIMVGLVSAPWQVLLLILILGILSYQWLIKRHHLQNVMADLNSNYDASHIPNKAEAPSQTIKRSAEFKQPVESEQPAEQVLYYRGATYISSVSPTSENRADTIEITGHYRGGLHRSSIKIGDALISNLLQHRVRNH